MLWGQTATAVLLSRMAVQPEGDLDALACTSGSVRRSREARVPNAMKINGKMRHIRSVTASKSG